MIYIRVIYRVRLHRFPFHIKNKARINKKNKYYLLIKDIRKFLKQLNKRSERILMTMIKCILNDIIDLIKTFQA